MIVRIRVVPNASNDELAGVRDGILRIRLKAVAKEGKANAALIRFLANTFHVPQNSIHIKIGQTSKSKAVDIPISQKDFLEQLRQF